MNGAAAVRRGRPLRALIGLAVLLALWIGWRLPLMGAQLAAITALLAQTPFAVRPVARALPVAEPAARPDMLRPIVARAAPTQAPPPAPVAEAPLLPPAPAAPAALQPPTPPAPTPPPPAAAPDPATRLAEAAYARLRAGDRRQAAALLDTALAVQPGNRQWQADRAELGRRWQIGGFSLLRDGGAGGPAASPVLGGGQMGGSIAFVLDPYARRPLALVARANVAADPAAIRSDTAQAAIGLRQTLAPGVSLSAERLIALGAATRGDWTLRLAGGGQRGRITAYGEAGLLGSGQAYAGAQASARVWRIGPAMLNAGSWASLQTGTPPSMPDVWRVDVGPSLSGEVKGIRLQADWRQRVAGNAAPGSGPVVTISAGF